MKPARAVDHDVVDRPRPTWRTAAPFIFLGLVGLSTILLPPYAHAGTDLALVLPPLVASGAFFTAAMLRREPSWLDPVGPWLFFLVVATARQFTGGGMSTLATLVALPILWLAMTGTRRQLHITTVLTGLVFVLPMVVVGSPTYPLSDWRRALLWVLLAALVAPAVQRVVQALARETARERSTSAMMDGITRGATLTAMIATDLDGKIVMFSRGAEEMLGCAEVEALGVGVEELYDPAELAAVAAELGIEGHGFGVLRELAHRSSPSRLWRTTRKDDSVLHTRLAFTELVDADGTRSGYLGVAVDATAGVRLIDQLSAAEARWRVLVDHIPDLSVVVLDEDVVIRTVAGVGIIQQGLKDHQGEPLAQASNPENMAALMPLIQAALHGGEGVTEVEATKNGTLHEVTLVPLPPEDDQARALLVARNVDDARRRERALLQAKQWAEGLFEDAPHGVAVVTTAGVVLQANQALRAMAGVGGSDLVGSRLGGRDDDEAAALLAHLDRALVAGGAMVEDAWSTLDRDGAEVHLALSSRLLDDHAHEDDVVLVYLVDVSERRRYEQRLAHLADHDALTGLANRRAFDDALARHSQRCERYGASGALLLLDLDHFKEVNDTLGHGAGDQLIISVAQLLRRNVRGGDLVARLGGDEFAVLLPEADPAGARRMARSLVSQIREHTSMLDGTRRRVTASIGAVMFAAVPGQEMDALALADMTMYDAKDAGRDGFAILEDAASRGPGLGARLEWTRRIDAALQNDDFVLHLQPILDLETGTVSSAEVLVRLADGDELTPPSHFLYIAERSGQVNQLDAWVLRRSIALLAELLRTRPDFRLEVNVSGHSIGDPVIEATIIEALAAHRVPPEALVLEITETAAVADVTLARQFAERMTRLGCRFALDDFGAGFGSFYYLKHLLFDYVKIDGDFVASCERSEVDRVIIRSIVGIAAGLGKKTVAEFVGSQEVLGIVRDEGVDFAQGHFIGRAVPVAEFVRLHLQQPTPV